MEPDKLKELESNIFTTGFVSEFEVAKILQKHGWNVINSRYYIDDIHGIVREIDIVAYKTLEIEDIRYLTALIISCKKSSENLWTFLTKDFAKPDPNIDFYPIFNWSNNRILNYMIENQDWKKRLTEKIETEDFLNEIYYIPRQVFAFQEMSKTSLKKQNDRNIFYSITSLIKAQSYELLSLENRKETECFYNFNLISIADTELFEVYLEKPSSPPQEISGTKYLNRYIVNQQDKFFKIDFVRFDAFDNYLKNYDELHSWNVTFYPGLIDEFYENVFDSAEKTELILDEDKDSIMGCVNAYANAYADDIQESLQIKDIHCYYDSDKEVLHIKLIADEVIDKETITYLNEDNELKKSISEWLVALFRYKGNFRFDHWVGF